MIELYYKDGTKIDFEHAIDANQAKKTGNFFEEDPTEGPKKKSGGKGRVVRKRVKLDSGSTTDPSGKRKIITRRK